MKAARFERLSHCQANKRIHGRVIVSRIESVDVARLIAVTAVIAIHTQPFFGSASIQGKYLSVAIDQLARFAVPLFFVISGSFWGIKIKNGAPIVPTSVAMAKRIFYIFIFWSIVYLLPYDLSTIADHGLLGPIKNAYWNLLKLADKPATVLMQGTKVHLWFLIALLCSVGISAFFVEKKHYKTLFALAIALYVFGLVGKAYANRYPRRFQYKKWSLFWHDLFCFWLRTVQFKAESQLVCERHCAARNRDFSPFCRGIFSLAHLWH
jgi:surface polysaccharide O-acyltransferase-like enzyme